MSRIQPLRLILVSAFVSLLATSAGAALFTITLANGTTFDTRERPVIAEWDENYVMFNTDRGNWIAVPKGDVVDVSSDAEATGFGYQLNSTTLYLGFTPGDILAEAEGAEGEDGQAQQGGEQAPPPDNTPIQYGGPQPDYGLDQFLDIPADGMIPSQPVDD